MPGTLKTRSLTPPPNARDPTAVEVLRIWAVPGEAQQVVLQTTWDDPGAWGLLLVDVARHAAKAYAYKGQDEAEVLARIRQFMDAEFATPTDKPRQI